MQQKKFFFFTNIKYCVWHFKRSLKIQKKKKKNKKKKKKKSRLCSYEIDNNNNLYTYYKAISKISIY